MKEHLYFLSVWIPRTRYLLSKASFGMLMALLFSERMKERKKERKKKKKERKKERKKEQN